MQDTLSDQLADAMGLGAEEPPVDEVIEDPEIGEDAEIEDGEEVEGEEAEIESILALAEANGWPVEELYNLTVGMPTEEDGEERPVSIGTLKDDLIATRAREKQGTASLAEMSERLKAAEQASQNVAQYDQAQRAMIGQVQSIDNYLTSPEFAELKVNDPGQAALKYQEAVSARQRLGQQYSQYSQQMQQQKKAHMAHVMADAEKTLLTNIPEWSNPDVANAEKQEIGKIFSELGYSGKELQFLSDPRAVMAGRRIYLAEKQLAAGKIAAGKVSQAPRTNLRGGRGITKQQQQKMQAGKMLNVAKKGTRADKVAAADALIKQAGGF